MSEGGVVQGYIVPGKPHPLLAPDKAPAWNFMRECFEEARAQIEGIEADIMLLYSTQWLSVIGHQIQADPEPKWTLVDQDFHDLGEMNYHFKMDAEFAHVYEECAQARGLHARTVAYRGFPIDTGTVVALKLLNPDNRIPACVVSCNMYADRAETLVLGKAAADALQQTGKRAIAVAVTAFSNRMFPEEIDPAKDRISSPKDDEWNRKILEILHDGRLEDVSQLARQFSEQANGDQKMKALWWLAALMGQHNRYEGNVFGYGPLWGTGAAVVGLTPSEKAASDLEFDEDDVEFYRGDRNVLSSEDADDDEADDEFDSELENDGDPDVVEDDDGTMSFSVKVGKDPGTISVGGGDRIEAKKKRPAKPAEDAAATAANPPAAKSPAAMSPGAKSRSPKSPTTKRPASGDIIEAAKAPRPVGAFPHARRVGNLLFLSGMGPRTPGTDEIPGGPVRDEKGNPRDYDIEAQTRAVIENIKTVLAASGASLENVVDVTCFLIDMERDFPTFNEIYAEYFSFVGATRTTVEVDALPTPIAVEFKVLAAIDD